MDTTTTTSINSNTRKPAICLNMIVKNESAIIVRLLDSVRPVISGYCICDTGSTDDTAAIIKAYADKHQLPGVLFHVPFQNFGYNRSLSLSKARELGYDYILLLDADMVFMLPASPTAFFAYLEEQHNHHNILGCTSSGGAWGSAVNPSSTAVQKAQNALVFQMQQNNSSLNYYNVRLLSSVIPVKCVGVTHEYYDYVENGGVATIRMPPTIACIKDVSDGGCKADKCPRDIALLSTALNDIGNSSNAPLKQRYQFYLANTYYDMHQYELAIKYYKERLTPIALKTGWIEEIFYVYLNIGHCYYALNNVETAIGYWLSGYTAHPARAESLYEIIKHYRVASKYSIAWFFYKLAKEIGYPRRDMLFINSAVYEYLLDYEASIIMYYVPSALQCTDKVTKLLAALFRSQHTQHLYSNLLSNYKFYSDIYILQFRMIRDFTGILDYVTMDGTVLYSSTPSIALYKNKLYMNVRYVNYKINHETGAYIYTGIYAAAEAAGGIQQKLIGVQQIITVNKCIVMNMDTMEQENSVVFTTAMDKGQQYCGIEDCKIAVVGGKLRFLGTVGYRNSLAMCHGEYDITAAELKYEVLASPIGASCEKNWCYIGDHHIIYKWYPLTIGTISVDNAFIPLKHKQNYEKNAILPWIFQHVRGSTNAVLYESRWWLITHIVDCSRTNAPRIYYHMIVVLNSDYSLYGYSVPLKFSKNSIEFCLGIVWWREQLVIAYSEWDHSTKLGFLDKVEVNALLLANK